MIEHVLSSMSLIILKIYFVNVLRQTTSLLHNYHCVNMNFPNPVFKITPGGGGGTPPKNG